MNFFRRKTISWLIIKVSEYFNFSKSSNIVKNKLEKSTKDSISKANKHDYLSIEIQVLCKIWKLAGMITGIEVVRVAHTKCIFAVHFSLDWGQSSDLF